ncbi:hypothetical protein GUJ93_ZPchr0005g15444 [Zizania palustris]|uniref:WRKY domain-containing protein n=1 Tax=Zizania palustris TaxID=103762 RepID=A0A8J5SKM3_ZIZPA|nr:hypothetical protein GUJ93_ZPchr0005g15444 [Zizania palustris]
MAASLGLNPEAFFSSYSCYSPSSFVAGGYTPDFPADVDFSVGLDDHRLFDYSPPLAAPALACTGDEYRRHDNENSMSCESEEKRARVNGREDRYGKKAVKNSPNPRNYYRCSSEGCNVKKRVERDRDDDRYVITTYDGVHNHASPAAAALQYAGSSYYSPPRSTGSPPAAAYYSSGSLLYS